VSDRQRIIDVDVHHQFSTAAAIGEYLPEGMSYQYYSSGAGIPHPHGAFRHDVKPPTGGVPGSDPVHVGIDHLDRHGIDHAVLMPGSLLGLCGLPDLDMAAALARATNDWTATEWLPADERFLGALLIAPRDPAQAVEEIRRLGEDPRFVQVTSNTLPCLMGDPFLEPIFAACEEVGLPFTMHLGSDYGVTNSAWPVGTPQSFCEYHAGVVMQAPYHLISLITQGVFVRHPTLKVVFNEFGVAWLPFVMWRLDMEFRAARDELPWLDRMPSEYIREHVRFTTQPLEEPTQPGDLATLLGLIGGEDLLLFSSDYPHWDADNPKYALRGFSEEAKRKIFFENAHALFDLDARLARRGVAGATV
jgi:uncharacterized protein